MNELSKESKEHIINLGGKDYKLSKVNLNVMTEMQERWDCELDKLGDVMTKKLKKQGAATLRFLVSVFLIEEYPEMTEQKVGSLINQDNIEECIRVLTEAVGG